MTIDAFISENFRKRSLFDRIRSKVAWLHQLHIARRVTESFNPPAEFVEPAKRGFLLTAPRGSVLNVRGATDRCGTVISLCAYRMDHPDHQYYADVTLIRPKADALRELEAQGMLIGLELSEGREVHQKEPGYF